MEAIKGNKVYTIDEAEKGRYIAQGYDIVSNEGEVIQYGAGKTVPYEEYEKLRKENETLKKELAKSKEKPIEDMTVEELTAYAAEKGIDIGKSTSQEGIIKKIKEAE